ncbi:hypothetical protein M8C21_018041 [Ambrosia artemisiifolia]|uniref:Uncharacterized protein n=1 Tax=Ambrosia artemisiifolia TaxID=4212 RepID=A0AAD5CT93_AMBAR|nr:hypothetical protein M8C21_018041 [Ambrosia artemisiifolia]
MNLLMLHNLISPEKKFDSDMAPADFILMEPGDAAGGNTFWDCDDEDEKKDTKSPDENGQKKDAKSPVENGEKKEVGQSQQENDDKMKVDKENDNNPEDNDQENGVNIAVKALREAFDAVGSLSSLDEKLSFANAGNPVMAMDLDKLQETPVALKGIGMQILTKIQFLNVLRERITTGLESGFCSEAPDAGKQCTKSSWFSNGMASCQFLFMFMVATWSLAESRVHLF